MDLQSFSLGIAVGAVLVLTGILAGIKIWEKIENILRR